MTFAVIKLRTSQNNIIQIRQLLYIWINFVYASAVGSAAMIKDNEKCAVVDVVSDAGDDLCADGLLRPLPESRIGNFVTHIATIRHWIAGK